MANIEKLEIPEYLFAEIPIKDGSFHDQRGFIYCPKYLSLIEVWPLEIGEAAWPREQVQKIFNHGHEEFLLVFVQNNVSLVNEQLSEIEILKGNLQIKDEHEVMQGAWEFFKKYLEWEDQQ